MPRRQTADPLAASIGQRIRALREREGMTLEGLAFKSDQISKGHLSDVERGLVVPTVGSLQVLASCLGVDLLDLVTFPEETPRQRVVELSRHIPDELLHRWEQEAQLAVEERARTPQRSPVSEPPILEKKPRNGVPLYSLDAAAGALGSGRSVSILGWVKLDSLASKLPGAFVARVTGKSMEPSIPDGALALFRRPGPGNRNGRTLLIQIREATTPEDGGAYLLKVFERVRENGQDQIRLRSRNPAVAPLLFPAEREELQVIAEFVKVL
ncbi:MAG: helix-turn-helix domain-containing protein [Polyangiaceae bacterium]|jgi:hypothetical protein|nr:helix-turn-helix domain-containing protein [Polyangiaceae bacterium]